MSKRALLRHKKGKRKWEIIPGPWIQKSAAPVSGTFTSSQDPCQPQPGASSLPSTLGASSSGSQPVKHGYKCSVCGKIKTRKLDLEGHMWSAYGMGEPIVCNEGSCSQRSFSCKSSLRQHIRIQHNKVFKFPCGHKNCKYGADNPDALLSHKINKHGMKAKQEDIQHKDSLAEACQVICVQDQEDQEMPSLHQDVQDQGWGGQACEGVPH